MVAATRFIVWLNKVLAASRVNFGWSSAAFMVTRTPSRGTHRARACRTPWWRTRRRDQGPRGRLRTRCVQRTSAGDEFVLRIVQHRLQLAARTDAQLGEDLAQVP